MSLQKGFKDVSFLKFFFSEQALTMRKTVLISISLLVLISLAVAGFWVKQNYFNKSATTSLSSPIVTKTFSLDLTSSLPDGSSTDKNKILLEGTTGKEAVLVVNGGATDTSVTTTDGKFSLTYTLVEGENQITITAFDETSGESKSISRSILYTPELTNL